jgi:expansin (peptidoglycan-binding protein)
MQVRNSNLPVKSLEVSTDNGKSWTGTARKDYNFFENPSGFRTQTVDVRVTSSTGSTIIVKGVNMNPVTEFKAASNFA